MLPFSEQNRQRVNNGLASGASNLITSSASYFGSSTPQPHVGGENGAVEMGPLLVSSDRSTVVSPGSAVSGFSLTSGDSLGRKSSLPQGGGGTFFARDRKYHRSELERLCFSYNRLPSSVRRFVMFGLIGVSLLLAILIHVLAVDPVTHITLNAMLISFFAGLFSLWLLTWILSFDEGTPQMQEIADPIREGSEGFFAVQYGTILRISVGFSLLIVILYAFRDSSTPTDDGSGAERPHQEQFVSSWTLAILTGLTFLVGALCSALSGYSGMWVSVRTNLRVASAARRCYNEALQLCFRGGAFSSVINVALAVGGISFIVFSLRLVFPTIPFIQIPLLVVGYGFGASLVAMFAQLGGGIYTKGADVGADLVGKVEAGIPEDDPRNPAVIADLVGDNVGDCAGQCADLFESIAAEIISAMILGGALAQEAKLSYETAGGFVLFPLGVHCMDLIVSSLGIMLVRTKKGLPDADSAHGAPEDPLRVMIRSYLFTCFVGLIGFCCLCRYCLFVEYAPNAWKYFAGCGAIGMIVAFLFVIITQYYTDYEYSQVKRIAEASCTGPATNVIAGLSVGMESTCLPVLCICVAICGAYHLGLASGISTAAGQHMSGLFGTAVATMGMLCTAVFVLSMSSFGPIADNAGGIVEMSQQDGHIRAITDRLDAVGNVTKANTKGFSVGSAALACFLLFSAFMDEVSVYSNSKFEMIDLAVPEVFVGGLLGAMSVFLFSAWAMEAVGRAAQQVVREVRRQFAESPGIMEFMTKPDYHTCVSIVSRSALREMIKPGLLSVLSPIVVGLLFRGIGMYQGNALLGAQVVAAFLMFSTATGILMALFLNNGGGAWDNAKKYIETGAFGGKGSDNHKAAVVGDTVGDPCKDTAGPSVHVLIKLVSTVTMVLTPVFVSSTPRTIS